MRSLVFSSLCAAFVAVPVTLSLPRYSRYVFPESARRDILGILGDVDGDTPSTAELANPFAKGSTGAGLTIFSKAGNPVSTSFPQITPTAPPKSTNSLEPTTHSSENRDSSTPDSATRTTSTAVTSTSPNTIGDITDGSATPPAELTEWKVIGIAVITITFIGSAVLTVSFFDSWWGFVRAAVCGKSRKGTRGLAGETLVPDWKKRSWEFKLSNEEGHRYPTLSSLDSIFKEKERAGGLAREGSGYDSPLEAPEMAYGGI